MKIIGSFNTKDNKYRYTVQIGYSAGTGITIEDGHEQDFDWSTPGHVFFAPDPVTISGDYGDLTVPVKLLSCTINLITDVDLVQQISNESRSSDGIRVTIIEHDLENNSTDLKIFDGYVEPEIYKEDYAYKYSSITLNCTERLGRLQYIKWRDTQFYSDNHTGEETDNVMLNMIGIMNICFGAINVSYNTNPLVSSDLTTHTDDMLHVKFNTDIFAGDDPDDQMTLYEVLTEVCKYINGFVVYNYRSSLDSSANITYYVINNDNWFTYHWNIKSLDETHLNGSAYHAISDNTSISTSESYSKIKLECNIEPVSTIVNMMNGTETDDSIYEDNPYVNYQRYLTEYIAPGEGHDAYDSFNCMTDPLDNTNFDYEPAYTLDHFFYVKVKPYWDFGTESYALPSNNVIQYETTNDGKKKYINQLDVLKYMSDTSKIHAAFIAFGRTEKLNHRDNTPISKIDLKDYLVIPIWGKCLYNQSNATEHNNYMVAKLNQYTSANPICKYTGQTSITLTPPDDQTTNYLVISGSMILNPLQPKSGLISGYWGDVDDDDLFDLMQKYYKKSLPRLRDMYVNYEEGIMNGSIWHKTVPLSAHDDIGYYQHRYWSSRYPNDMSQTEYIPKLPTDNNYSSAPQLITPYLEHAGLKQCEYNWSYTNDGYHEQDKILKLPILCCELKVGDKWCVETLTDYEHESQYEWLTQEQLTERNITEPYITLGINPKIGQYIIGEKYEITQTVKYDMNVDGKGMAIPIKFGDNVSGNVSFKIIKPYDIQWDYIRRTHPTLFRSTSWSTDRIYLLEYIQSIMIESLKIDVISNNGMVSTDKTTADNDLVYYSSTNNVPYDDELSVDLKICTGLTTDEFTDWGIKNEVSKSYVTNPNDTIFTGWDWSRGNDDFIMKPEHMIVDRYYREYYKPYVMIDTTFSYSRSSYNDFSTYYRRYTIDYYDPNKNMKIMNFDHSLQNRSISGTFKEFIPNQDIYN